MSLALRGLLASLALFAACSVSQAGEERRQHYWNNYWRWYDTSYRPYYHRPNPRPYIYGGSTTYVAPAPGYVAPPPPNYGTPPYNWSLY